MNKPKLSLALSLLAVAGQAGLLPVVAAPKGDFEPNQLIAQAAADQSAYVTSQPIPPVVNGVVEFEEFKTTNAIDLKVSQSRTFKFKNKIVRTSISDPGIAEPVVVSENQMVLLGKSPGTCTMLLWDDAGNSISVDLRVSKDYSQLQATLREIDPRIIVKAYNVGGSDRVLLTGDVDHPESIIRAFAASNVFMDDRGMNIQVANSRIIAAKIGESGTTGGAGGGGGSSGQLAQLNSVDRYTFFGNIPNNIGKAQVMLSDGGRVTSLVKVRKVPLIALHVSFMEMNTAAARELGTQLGFGVSGNGYAFGVGGFGGNAAGNAFSAYGGARFLQALTNQTAGGTGGIPVTIGSSQAIIGLSPSTPSMQTVSFVSPNGVRGFGQPLLLNAPATLLQQAVLLGTPGGASITPGGLINMFTGLSNFGRQNFNGSGPQFSVNPTIQGIISNRRARVLAEPTLVTISGERASFLAGGEIPIIQQVATAGTALNSVTFEPFGMRINMIPVLQENGTINLEVSPEERILSAALAFSLGPGTQQQIPGFTTRKSQTIVELKPGQELFLCGLVSSNNGREITKLPMLGEIPVLGALYRSKAFNKNESELVVSVRPEIILPGTPGQLKLPEEIGRVEGPRDLNMFQVEPTVIDERHHTSGRSERHQKTSPTLPEGAPIPDNE
ncbi:MAG: Pilus assembly protein N-terminal protein [Cyanobacteriota bacterium erpe_2018_sw_39hr_WHONDRS-SW48-000098_B_bin.30]|jgi:Flp pilus assembly secretin CpaC|nr:pilus assembly protein N-terminal domain-containing protein [Candidatus Obscuribacter sp.]MDQ5967175.1 Pilus assembly protein N-terminal protein [Cyanobacteriota bacterium erpe_2018_sw_39hr_WHONDRS-SW48-000098_B_bin.30]